MTVAAMHTESATSGAAETIQRTHDAIRSIRGSAITPSASEAAAAIRRTDSSASAAPSGTWPMPSRLAAACRYAKWKTFPGRYFATCERKWAMYRARPSGAAPDIARASKTQATPSEAAPTTYETSEQAREVGAMAVRRAPRASPNTGPLRSSSTAASTHAATPIQPAARFSVVDTMPWSTAMAHACRRHRNAAPADRGMRCGSND